MKISKNRLNFCREFTFNEKIEEFKRIEKKLYDESVRFFDRLFFYIFIAPIIAIIIMLVINKCIS